MAALGTYRDGQDLAKGLAAPGSDRAQRTRQGAEGTMRRYDNGRARSVACLSSSPVPGMLTLYTNWERGDPS